MIFCHDDFVLYNYFVDYRFDNIRAGSTKALSDLDEHGFVVIPCPFDVDEMARISEMYDRVIASATSDDIRVGSTTTRVKGFADLKVLFTHPSLLEAASRIIGGPFRLSSIHSRTLHANVASKDLHIDFGPGEDRFPLASFIFMVDEFRKDNGATGFVPGSHRWPSRPEGAAETEVEVTMACGEPGSLIVFDGSVWHGHTANLTDTPRRSIQGAFVPLLT